MLATADLTSTHTTLLRRHRHDLLAGARAMTPWLLGIAPYGLVIGMSAAHAGIPTLAGWLTGPLIYAGSAQVASIELLDTGATPLVVITAVLAINFRLVLYSATMARHWQGTPAWWKALAAYLLVDPSVAVGVAGYEANAGQRGHAHYLGAAVLLWVTWLTTITIGATVGAAVPGGLHLEMVIPLFLVGEVVVRAGDRVVRRAVAVAVVTAVAGLAIPFHLGPLVAIAAGVAAGLSAKEVAS